MNLPQTEEDLRDTLVACASHVAKAINDLKRGQTASIGCEVDKFMLERNKPQLIDGLTIEQWQQVRDEGLLCEFMYESEKRGLKTTLGNVNPHDAYPFSDGDGCDTWEHCRIHKSQPQFNTGKKPDWLEDEQMIAVKYTSGKPVIMRAWEATWSMDYVNPIVRWEVVNV